MYLILVLKNSSFLGKLLYLTHTDPTDIYYKRKQQIQWQKVIKWMPTVDQKKNQWHSIKPNYLAAKHFHKPDDTPLPNVVAWS